MNRTNRNCRYSLLGCVMLAGTVASAQESWQMPYTSAGQPDLQGHWTNSTVIPFERPETLADKAFYTQEEADALLQRALTPNETEFGTDADVHYQFEDYGLARSQNATAINLRTSIITSPENGRLPPLLPEAQQRMQQRLAYNREHSFDSAQDRSLSERCLIWSNEGPSIIPLGYNSNYQIVQTPDHVVILLEMIHDARIIPLLDEAPASSTIAQWLGNSWGHWEGDTLIVETTGFSGKAPSRGPNVPLDVHAKVIERITRTSATSLQYEFTLSDPTLWAQPWSGEYPMLSIEGPMFEYACHEGNYGMANNLSGARVTEQQVKE